MSAFDTFQFFSGGGNCSVSGSTLTIVSRALYRSGCTQTQQSCILATPPLPNAVNLVRRQSPSTETTTVASVSLSTLASGTTSAAGPSATTPATNGAYAPVFANCTVSTSTNITVGAFFDQSSVNSNLPYFVYSTYDDAACEKWSAKALRVQHLTAFVAGSRCIQRDPRNNATLHTAFNCDDSAKTVSFRDNCDSSCSRCTAGSQTFPYYQCIRNPFDPQTYISGYCTVANSLDMPALPNPALYVTTTLVTSTAPTAAATTTSKPSAAAPLALSNVGRWVVGLVACSLGASLAML